MMLLPDYVEIISGEYTENEINHYIMLVRQKHGGADIKKISFELDESDGEPYVNIRYELAPVRFERIRRITGYLVGSLDRFNDAKRDEVSDRVSHST